MTGRHGDSPIEDYLDDLVRRTRAEPRTLRRLLDEANDHLYTAAADLQAAGMARPEAEREAVRRLGSTHELAHGSRWASYQRLVVETGRAAVLLAGWGLVGVGLSGGFVAAMNALFGLRFVGAASVLGTGGRPIAETAHDAVALRVLAGIVGLLLLAGYGVLRRYSTPAVVLPDGLVEALGAAAFAAATAVLLGASADQAAAAPGGYGIGWFLSGALASLIGTIVFTARATRALLPAR